jgi:hypothetical protein
MPESLQKNKPELLELLERSRFGLLIDLVVMVFESPQDYRFVSTLMLSVLG